MPWYFSDRPGEVRNHFARVISGLKPGIETEKVLLRLYELSDSLMSQMYESYSSMTEEEIIAKVNDLAGKFLNEHMWDKFPPCRGLQKLPEDMASRAAKRLAIFEGQNKNGKFFRRKLPYERHFD